MDRTYYSLVIEKLKIKTKFYAFLSFFPLLDNINYIVNILRLKTTLKIKTIPMHSPLVGLLYASI
jgi:hypothetical protein